MKLVVTGASGFLGQAVMRNLLHTGADAVGVTRHCLPGLVQVASYADVPGGDVLVHLAEASDRQWVAAHADSYERTTLLTLESLLGKGFQRVVYASSAVLYGDQSEVPHGVGDPVQVVDAYTRLKYASEQAVLGCFGTVARLVNLYGPGMAAANVLSTILKQLPLAGPIRVFDASPVRDFLWIDDAARALSAMAIGEASGIFNVGTGVGTSIQQLADAVLIAAGQAGRSVESGQQRDKHPSRLLVEIAQTEATFGWRPDITLSEGIGNLLKMINK